jgi:hypothetical protein
MTRITERSDCNHTDALPQAAEPENSVHEAIAH